MWRYQVGSTELYDARARLWSPDLGTFLSIDEFRSQSDTTTLWGWPNQNPIGRSDPFGHDGTTDNPIQQLVNLNLLPPGLTIFGKGVRERSAGLSMMSNDATFEQGMAKYNCGNAMIAAGAGITGTDAAVIVGAAQAVLGAASAARGGGSYSSVRSANQGGEVHHMPSWGAMKQWEGNPFSYDRAPGILMDKADHMITESYGSSAAAQSWQASSAQMLNDGRFLDALAHDIIDVQSKFPGKYDAAIDQMLQYLWSGNW